MMAITDRTIMHRERQARNLRVVDPFTDEFVWAIIDVACNSNCHGELWHANATVKWAKNGFKSYLVSNTSTNFRGVGSSGSTGKHKLPIALRLKESGLVIPGMVDSHEIPGTPKDTVLYGAPESRSVPRPHTEHRQKTNQWTGQRTVPL